MPIRTILGFWLLLFAMRGQSSPGLSGVVNTAQGSPMPGASVAAFSPSGELVQSTRTGGSGEWAMPLPVGQYRLRIEAPGFEPQFIERIESPGAAGNVILTPESKVPAQNVESERAVIYHPVVDPERTDQADFIDAGQLMNLPVNRRNYLDLALLTPGVTSSDSSANISTGLQAANNPQSGLSISGNDGRGNIFWLDGGENYINTGGVRTSISQEAVAEFQISRNSFSAEFGGGIGGIVNTISKSGTNALHGDVFGFLRQRQFNARNYFDPGSSPYTRVQSGITLGGPIRHNKTYFFAAFERLDRHESAFVNIFRNPSDLGGLSLSQQKLIPFLGPLGGLVKQALDPANYPRTLALLARNTGAFPLTERDDTGSLRVDHSISDNDQIFFRLNATEASSINTNLQSLTGESQGEKNTLHDVTLLANNNLVLNARLVSETRLSFNFYDSYTSPHDSDGPEIRIAGVASLGRGAFLPTKLREWHGQFQQNFFYTPGRHSMRFGADVNPLRNGPVTGFRQGGQVIFGKFLPLAAFLNQAAGSPSAAAMVAQSLAAAGQPQLISALNEPISALQDFNLGIPAAYVQSFGDGGFVRWTQRYNFFLNDVFRATPRLTINLGVRYELELNKDLPNSYNNIAPRVGFAWAATGDRKTVLRGGFGIYHQRNNLETLSGAVLFASRQLRLLSIPITGVPGSRSPFTGGPVTSADVYQALLAEGILGNRPIAAQDFAQFGIPPGSDPYPTLVSFDKHWRRPYSEQASFEVERAVGRMSVSVAFNFNRALHLPRVRDTNIAYGPTAPDGSPTYVPLNPAIFLKNVFEPRGRSFYSAAILQVARRFSPRLTLDAHYTLSRVTDDATQIGDLPNNSLDVRQDRGLASFHQKHRFVASAVIVPKSPENRAVGSVFGGFLFAPIVVAGSGLPFNVETGLQDGQRPFGVGRNTGRGPAYVSFDTRISRTLRLSELFRLELIGEGFNLLNRTNFTKLNNIVGNIGRDQLPSKLEGVRGNSSDPFSFTSANAPRQIQVALKLRW